MNSQDWLNKYYPKPPSENMTKRQAIEHSLRKWQGLRAGILEVYGLYKESSLIRKVETGRVVLQIDASSCALCVKYYTREFTPELQSCAKCPLAQSLGNPCDKSGYGNRPYTTWTQNDNPIPMIKALKKTLKALEK